MSEIKVQNPVGEALDEIYRWFDVLNAEFFQGTLVRPILTIQKARKGVLGYCTVDKVWRPCDMPETDEENEDCCYEINLAAQALDKDAVEMASIIQHELVHLDNLMKNIKDVSGKIHNKKFKAAAESHGLICEKDKKVGWGYTRATPEFEEFVNDELKPDMSKFSYYRVVPEKPTEEKEKKVFKFYCPNCGQKISGKKDINIICGICNQPFTCDDLEDNTQQPDNTITPNVTEQGENTPDNAEDNNSPDENIFDMS